VTVTATGDLDAGSAFFTTGETEKLVYCTSSAQQPLQTRLGSLATVVGLGDEVAMIDLLTDLRDRGVRRLMVEGGGTVHTQFLANGLADELQLVIAPFFVGDGRAPRLVRDAPFPWTAEHPARLLGVKPIGDVVLLRYGLSDRCPDEPSDVVAGRRAR
jgi:5-amino-6-(5-phosphoribosylamino)uracil reductase